MTTYEVLLKLAKERPRRHQDVRKMLIKWYNEIRLRRRASKINQIKVSIEEIEVRYHTQYMSQEDAFDDLQEIYENHLDMDETVRLALIETWSKTVKSIKEGKF